MSEARFRRGERALIADRYFVITEIGSGGMGTVYRGHDRHTGQTVAVKLLHPHLRRDPAYVARFRREAALAMRLDSRHIVQTLDYGIDGGEPYIVMEFIQGQTLGELLRQGPLSSPAAAYIGVQLARALAEAHGKGVIHRDLKPRNVMIQADGVVKLADFGVARAEDSDSGSETNQFGAAAYMAPERFAPQRFGAVDRRTDLYSLGVVLYEMLAGYAPFAGDPYELLHAILEDEPQPIEALLPDLDPALAAIIRACLTKQASQRPANAGEVASTLQPLADATQLHLGGGRGVLGRALGVIAAPVTLPLHTILRRRRRGTRSRRDVASGGAGARIAAIALGVVAVVALAAAVAFAFHQADRSSSNNGSGVATSSLASETPVATVAPQPTPVACLDGAATPITQALARCPAAKTSFNPTCPIGRACAVSSDAAGAQTLAVNDATVALVDDSGALVIARPDGTVVQHLSNRGQVQQPAWSPDGRYLAYVSSQVVQPGDTPETSLYATQLRVVEPQNAGNDWVVAASTERMGADEAQRRLISWPHWSANGRSILFLWTPALALAGDGVYEIDLPSRDAGLDASKLQKEPPPGDFYAVTPLQRLQLSAADFGYAQGSLGQFATAADGRLLLQVCDSNAPSRQCGLGSWDGKKARMVVAQSGGSFLLAQPTLLPGADDLYAYVYSFPSADRLVHVNLATGEVTRVADIDRGVTLGGPFLPRLAVSADGKSLLTASGSNPAALSLVNLADGTQAPWVQGYAPAWFVPTAIKDAPALLPSEPWTPPPAPAPTPTLVLTPAARALPMTIAIEVRRHGSTVSSAEVDALIDAQQCATGSTDAAGRLQLTLPAVDAPADCFKPGATVTFRVNGSTVTNQVTFSPQASAQAPIALP